MTNKAHWLDHVLALENLLSGLGVVALSQVLFPDLLGRWYPGPFYTFTAGAVLLMVGSYLRNKRKAKNLPPSAPDE